MVRITDAMLKKKFDPSQPKPELDMRRRGGPGYCSLELLPYYTPEHFTQRLPSNIEEWTREEIIAFIREEYHPDSTKGIENREKLW